MTRSLARFMLLCALGLIAMLLFFLYILIPLVSTIPYATIGILSYVSVLQSKEFSPISHFALTLVVSLLFYFYYSDRLSAEKYKFERDKASLEIQLDKQKEYANIDPVTKVPIQGVFNKHLTDKINVFTLDPLVRLRFSVTLLDLKEFKKINDRYGLQVGDKFLEEFAQLIMGSIRKAENIYRHVDEGNGLYRAYKTGDEFMIMLYGTEIDALSFLLRLKDRVIPEHSPKFGRLIGQPAFKPSFYAAVKEIYPGDSPDIVMEVLNQHLVLAKNRHYGRNIVWASGKTDAETHGKFMEAFR